MEDAWIEARLRGLRQIEPVKSVEFLSRFVLVIICTITGWQYMDLVLLPFWAAIYYFVVFFEKFLLLGNFAPRRPLYSAVVLASFLISATYTFLPVYLWAMGGPIWRLASLTLMVGGALNVFLLRSHYLEIAIAYMIPMTVAMFALAVLTADGDLGSTTGISALVLAVCLSAYFGVAVWEAHRAAASVRRTNIKFMEAQKREAIGALTSGLAHDFNNILSVVQGNLELIRDYGPDQLPDRDQVLNDALEANARAAELTRQLLGYARKAALDPRPVPVGTALDDVERLAKRVIPSNIALRFHDASRDAAVMADPTMLQSALLNLAINARDAMPDGGQLSVSARQQVDGASVVFRVRDTGCGIDPSDLPKVTDPFYSTKARTQGSGLGLSMVAGFAEQSGGRLEIHSQLGQGTEIALTLPKALPLSDEPELEDEARSAG